ncbi:NusG domain II-containing protein [Anaeromicrobium sediminis]|uniref:Uncharacterized protein n=1 Tax=Anaeromicrobium sediminis TaxID=1478221 RepID=A0A267MIB9_9FIRM|nr:NusG domain II-containing protein [Anaeromicrobium sediminis]PAB58615.1 hypothetical protein CCE28_14120 [Anaeromicrobium sediminis]
MTIGDKVLIISILILSIVGIVSLPVLGSNSNEKYVVIKIEDKIIKKISIEKSGPGKIYDFQFNNNTGHIEVKDGSVRMLKMDKAICPKSICSQTGWINKEYESIVCLPNKIMVTFQSNSEEELDIITY